jgi:hypothetical protein
MLSSLSATSDSENRPGKVIRWSVAIEPVTAMRTRGLLRSVGGRQLSVAEVTSR